MCVTYHYIVDLDERGEFSAHVEEAETGKIIWEVDTEEAQELVQDGFIKRYFAPHTVEEHLKYLNIISQNDKVTKP